MTGTIPETAPPASEPDPDPDRRNKPRVTRVLLIVVLGIHALAAAGQPFLAGAYLSGDVDAIDVHSVSGSMLVLVSLVQFVIAVLFWRPGRGPLWPALATAALFFAEIMQVAVGYVRVLAVHVPLGVAIVGAAVAMFWWSLVWRPAP